MVIREALNNIVKHAKATEMTFSLPVEPAVLADNGIGFARENSSLSGNGLLNMEKRITSIGGKFALENKPGKGTRLRLEIPWHR